MLQYVNSVLNGGIDVGGVYLNIILQALFLKSSCLLMPFVVYRYTKDNLWRRPHCVYVLANHIVKQSNDARLEIVNKSSIIAKYQFWYNIVLNTLSMALYCMCDVL